MLLLFNQLSDNCISLCLLLPVSVRQLFAVDTMNSDLYTYMTQAWHWLMSACTGGRHAHQNHALMQHTHT